MPAIMRIAVAAAARSSAVSVSSMLLRAVCLLTPDHAKHRPRGGKQRRPPDQDHRRQVTAWVQRLAPDTPNRQRSRKHHEPDQNRVGEGSA